jgi:hypothetical protein
LQNLHRHVLAGIERNRPIIPEARNCARRNVHDRAILATRRDIHMRHFARQKSSIEKDVVIKGELIG